MISLILAAAAHVIVAPVPKDATFGDWTVACDNVRHCEGFALPPADDSERSWLLYLSRRAAGAAAPTVEAYPAYSDGDGVPARLRIDGRDTPFRFDGNGRAQGDGAALLAAVAAARKVEAVDGSGKVLATIPVTGASAALRWIDDRQKRVGTVVAIVAKGTGPASAVPPPPPLPRISQPPVSKAPPRKLRRADGQAVQLRFGHGWCDAERSSEVATYRLDAKHTLGIVGCMMGAYQGASVVIVIDEMGNWNPAQVEQARSDGTDADNSGSIITEASYDPKTRLLGMFAKGRGLTDCGASATWAWDGTMFRLASYQALDPCLGAPPGMWLSRWQTANDPLKDE